MTTPHCERLPRAHPKFPQPACVALHLDGSVVCDSLSATSRKTKARASFHAPLVPSCV